MPYTIRRAGPADAEIVADFNARLAHESEGKTLDSARLLPGVRALLADEHKGVYHLALDEQGKPIAQVMYTYEWSDWRNGWFWWLQSVYVVAGHRGRGVFRQLFDHVLETARRRGDVIGMRLYVDNNNTRAHEVYARCGFQRAGYFVLERDVEYSMADSHYLHGTEPFEQQRLARLNELLNAACLRELALRGGERVLDVGSGLGQLTRAMARAAGTPALGVERSLDQLAEARRYADEAGDSALVEFRPGEAAELPLRHDEWGTFDLVHTRFVLEHVRAPLRVVEQMVRAARPGGRIVLQDDAHDIMRLAPEPPGFRALWNAYIRSYDRVGNDSLIGHRLVALLHDAGAIPTRNTWLFFGSCAGQVDFPAYVENLLIILQGVRQTLLEMCLTDAAIFEETIAAVRRWMQRPDAAFWYAISWAEGRRP